MYGKGMGITEMPRWRWWLWKFNQLLDCHVPVGDVGLFRPDEHGIKADELDGIAFVSQVKDQYYFCIITCGKCLQVYPNRIGTTFPYSDFIKYKNNAIFVAVSGLLRQRVVRYPPGDRDSNAEDESCFYPPVRASGRIQVHATMRATQRMQTRVTFDGKKEEEHKSRRDHYRSLVQTQLDGDNDMNRGKIASTHITQVDPINVTAIQALPADHGESDRREAALLFGWANKAMLSIKLLPSSVVQTATDVAAEWTQQVSESLHMDRKFDLLAAVDTDALLWAWKVCAAFLWSSMPGMSNLNAMQMGHVLIHMEILMNKLVTKKESEIEGRDRVLLQEILDMPDVLSGLRTSVHELCRKANREAVRIANMIFSTYSQYQPVQIGKNVNHHPHARTSFTKPMPLDVTRYRIHRFADGYLYVVDETSTMRRPQSRQTMSENMFAQPAVRRPRVVDGAGFGDL